MQNNSKLAIAIIAALGLLLGLSVAQHYRQYRQIKALEQRLESSAIKVHPHCRKHEPKIIWIEREKCEISHPDLERQRAEIEAIKAKMRADREAQLSELRQQIEQVQQMWKRGN